MIRLVAALLTIFAVPAAAAVFEVPDGCTPIASVQHRQCLVSLYWRCAGQAGYTSASADEGGVQWVTIRDEGGQWAGMRHLPTGFGYMTSAVSDPSDHRRVVSDGADHYIYRMTPDGGGPAEIYTGVNVLAGPAEIDGEAVQAIDYDYKVRDERGAILRQVAGTAYLWGEGLISISGPWQSSEGVRGDIRPVEILTPGEPGFMETEPRYDCGGELS